MRIVQPHVLVEDIDSPRILKRLERRGRICYKSEANIKEGSAAKFIRGIIDRGHESVIEHITIGVVVLCNRGVSHEWVRHRIAAYSQESSRYCNYTLDRFGNEITCVEPCDLLDRPDIMAEMRDGWLYVEQKYFNMINLGAKPEQARRVLPIGLKTEIAATHNLREWRHILGQRADRDAHPDMRQVAIPLLLHFKEVLPVVFDDISYDTEFPPEHYAKVIVDPEL